MASFSGKEIQMHVIYPIAFIKLLNKFRLKWRFLKSKKCGGELVLTIKKLHSFFIFLHRVYKRYNALEYTAEGSRGTHMNIAGNCPFFGASSSDCLPRCKEMCLEDRGGTLSMYSE